MAEYRGVSGVARKVTKVYRGVNGVARNVSKQYRGVSGVARNFFGVEPWEEALEDAGYSPSSLEETLKDSEACIIIANDEEAVAFISENYKEQLSSCIDSDFSDGLNLLCYKCKTKTYLFRDGNKCTNITGGWTVDNGSFGSNYVEVHGVWDWDKANSYDGYGGEAGGAYTVNKLQLTGFSKYGCYCAVNSGGYTAMKLAMGGSVHNGNSYWYADGYTQNTFVSTTDDIEATTYYTTETMDDTKRASVRASDPRSHPGNDSIVFNIKGTFYKIWVE